MAGADRAINMALRVRGIGDVERDFKRAGDAGEKSFSRIEKSANGAAREVSEYHARLKRVATAARADTANIPDLNKGPALDSARARNRFVLDRVDAEKNRIRSGMPDLSLPGAADGAKDAGLLAAGLRGVGGAAGLASIGLSVVVGIVGASVVAFNEHDRALDKFNATLAYSGNVSGQSADQITEMAERISDATLQTEEATLSAAASLARVPFITAQGLEAALDASARFADAMGTDVAETAAQTSEALTAIARNDLPALAEAMKGANAGWRDSVLNMMQAGNAAGATQAYIDGLAKAAGDGPNGAALSASKLSKSWDNLKQSVGENFAGPAAGAIDGLTSALDTAADATGRLLRGLLAIAAAPITGLDPVRSALRGRSETQEPLDGSASWLLGRALGGTASVANEASQMRLDAILNPKKQKRTRTPRGGGGGGKSDAEREAERLAREAEAARKAADRVREANDDIIASYRLRADDIREQLGLEGAALDAVQRRQAIDAIARRLSTDEIEKEVDALRKLAAVKKLPFDEKAATDAAKASLGERTAVLRDTAASLYDAERAQADFNKQQERAAAVYEMTRTPLELINREVSSLVDMLRIGDITADMFERRMNQLAEGIAAAALRGREAWAGLGDEVSGTLKDIIFNGGSAMDVLRELVGIAASRMFDKNIGDPLAGWIDGLTGNNRDKNIAAARATLPNAAGILGGGADGYGVNGSLAGNTALAQSSNTTALSVGNLGTQSDLTATALGRLSAIPDFGAPVAALGNDAEATGAALRAAGTDATRFGGSLAQVIASLAGGGGGGASGLLGLALNLGLAAATGGSGSSVGITNGGAAIKAAGKTKGFAGGGLPPIGMPFDVGENGRETMILYPGGGGRVINGEQTRRMANDNSGPAPMALTINVPAGADPRRTTTTISRAVQGGIQRAMTKGLARGPRRVRS